MNGAPPGHTTIRPTVSRALDGLSPVRGNVPLRIQTTAAAGQIWVAGELDVETASSDAWQRGGRVRIEFDHERGAAAPTQSEVALEAGQRTFVVSPPPGTTLAPGRYVLRIQARPEGSTLPLQTTAEVVVPEPAQLIAESGLAFRRGPSTGRSYVPTADARFRRTERIRFEVPRGEGDGTVTAQLLGRDGKPLTVALTVGERVDDESKQRLIVADVTLAPLAQGDYALEITIERGDRKESAVYAFQLVP
jgi:hypothetical protein